MAPHPQASDEELALSTSEGDRDAFAELYNRHFQGVYDLVFRMVREAELAADISQNTFIRAWENLQKRTVSGNVRAWLLTIARNTAINEIERKKRWRSIVAPEPEGGSSPAFEVVDTSRLSNPEAVVDDKELVDLVWSSAAALGPKDYSLLDLHLRKDLSAGEMAENLGLPSSRVHVMLSRLRDSLEESVSVALLVRRGRRDCAALSEVLEGATRDFTRDTRLEVRRHLKECDFCAESRRRFVAPAEIFSGLAMVPVSEHFASDTWFKISASLVPGAGALAILGGARDRLTRWWAHGGVALKGVAITVMGVLVAVPVGVAILASDGGGGDTAVATSATPSSRQARQAAVKTSPSAGEAADGSATPVADDTAVAAAAAFPGAGQTSSAPPAPGVTAAPGQSAPGPGAPPTTPPPAAPTVAPTPPPPEPTPAPTAAPPPTDGADVALVSVTMVATTQPVAGLQFYVSATALLQNYGGATAALVDTSFSLTASPGCTVSPAAPVTVQDKNVPLGSDVTITRSWSVTCSAGDHTFSVDSSVAIDGSQALSDPNPGNNAGNGAVVVPVLP
jgi:RNA polymerase sigma factor (sigma-70 family)